MRAPLLLLCSALIVFASCNKQPDVKPVTEWDEYSDQFFKVTFRYPKGWHVVTEVNKVTIYNDSSAVAKFFDPFSKNPLGAQIIVAADRIDTVQDLGKYSDAFRSDLNASGYDVKPAEARSIEGIAGQMTAYSGRFDKENALRASRTIVLKDSTFYYVHFGGFNEFYEPYKAVYDTIIASLVLPKPIVKLKNEDVTLPSPDLAKQSDAFVEFMYPNNWSVTFEKPKGEVEYTVEMRGERFDAKMDLDVRPAKKLTLDKLYDQNSKIYKGASGKKSTTVSGEPAVYLTYPAAKNVEGRVYFVVKNDKFTRIIVFCPMDRKKDFWPALEKAIASIRLKQ